MNPDDKVKRTPSPPASSVDAVFADLNGLDLTPSSASGTRVPHEPDIEFQQGNLTLSVQRDPLSGSIEQITYSRAGSLSAPRDNLEFHGFDLRTSELILEALGKPSPIRTLAEFLAHDILPHQPQIVRRVTSSAERQEFPRDDGVIARFRAPHSIDDLLEFVDSASRLVVSMEHGRRTDTNWRTESHLEFSYSNTVGDDERLAFTYFDYRFSAPLLIRGHIERGAQTTPQHLDQLVREYMQGGFDAVVPHAREMAFLLPGIDHGTVTNSRGTQAQLWIDSGTPHILVQPRSGSPVIYDLAKQPYDDAAIAELTRMMTYFSGRSPDGDHALDGHSMRRSERQAIEMALKKLPGPQLPVKAEILRIRHPFFDSIRERLAEADCRGVWNGDPRLSELERRTLHALNQGAVDITFPGRRIWEPHRVSLRLNDVLGGTLKIANRVGQWREFAILDPERRNSSPHDLQQRQDRIVASLTHFGQDWIGALRDIWRANPNSIGSLPDLLDRQVRAAYGYAVDLMRHPLPRIGNKTESLDGILSVERNARFDVRVIKNDFFNVEATVDFRGIVAVVIEPLQGKGRWETTADWFSGGSRKVIFDIGDRELAVPTPSFLLAELKHRTWSRPMNIEAFQKTGVFKALTAQYGKPAIKR